jgi:mono/diheme cytochrome c family protein
LGQSPFALNQSERARQSLFELRDGWKVVIPAGMFRTRLRERVQMGIPDNMPCGRARIRFWVVLVAAALAMTGGSAAAIAQNTAAPAPVSLAVLSAEGASIYRTRCAKCHGRNGEGKRHGPDIVPRLVGNFAHLSVKQITVQVIRGGSYMPPFANFTDREIAAVATYIRNAFGNDHGIASQAEVAGNR